MLHPICRLPIIARVFSRNVTRRTSRFCLMTPRPMLILPRRQSIALFQHSIHTTISISDQQHDQAPLENPATNETDRKMLIGFTCEVCKERSHHVMSKHSYTKGVVLIQCPGCKNRHLIADNLGWFKDTSVTVEDLVKEKGEAIRRIVVDEQGVEKLGDLMEWLPDIAEEEKAKKEQAKKEAEKFLKNQQEENSIKK